MVAQLPETSPSTPAPWQPPSSTDADIRPQCWPSSAPTERMPISSHERLGLLVAEAATRLSS